MPIVPEKNSASGECSQANRPDNNGGDGEYVERLKYASNYFTQSSERPFEVDAFTIPI